MYEYPDSYAEHDTSGPGVIVYTVHVFGGHFVNIFPSLEHERLEKLDAEKARWSGHCTPSHDGKRILPFEACKM